MVLDSITSALLATIIREAVELLSAQGGAIFLVNETDHGLDVCATDGAATLLKGFKLRFGEGIAGVAAKGNKPLIANDYPQSSYNFFETSAPLSAVLAVPLVVHRKTLGVLELFSNSERRFEDKDILVAEPLASVAASAIHGSMFRAEVEKQRDELAETQSYLTTVLEHLQGQENLALIGLIYGEDIHLARSKLGLAKAAARDIVDTSSQLPHRVRERARRIWKSINEYLDTLEKTQLKALRSPKPQPLNVHETLSSVIGAKRIPPGISIINRHTPDSIVVAPTQQVRQVFHVLVQNAIDAMGTHGTLTLATSSPPGRNDFLKVSVTDTGRGIPKKQRASLFRLITPSQVQKGARTGMGLAWAYAFIRSYGGDISFTTSGNGTTMQVYLPRDFGGAPSWQD